MISHTIILHASREYLSLRLACSLAAASGQPFLRKPCRLADMQRAIEQGTRPVAVA